MVVPSNINKVNILTRRYKCIIHLVSPLTKQCLLPRKKFAAYHCLSYNLLTEYTLGTDVVMVSELAGLLLLGLLDGVLLVPKRSMKTM